MSCVCSYASGLYKKGGIKKNSEELAELFCHEARTRILRNFQNINSNADQICYDVAQNSLAGKFAWLENDIMEHKNSGVSQKV